MSSDVMRGNLRLRWCKILKNKNPTVIGMQEHNHKFVDCLFRTPNGNVYKGSCCSICAKPENVQSYSVVERGGRKCLLTSESLLNMYKELPIVHVERIF